MTRNRENAAPAREGDAVRTRRDFLKRTAAKLTGVAVVVLTGDAAWVSASALTRAAPADGGALEYDPTKHRWVYLIDISKCIGCGSCVRACERENDVPKGVFRTWIERYRVSRTGDDEIDSPDGGRNGFDPVVSGADITKAFFVPKLCNHCTHTPCVQLCPVGASYQSPDGVILVDEQRCVGCSYCVQACPYGSRFIHPKTHTASKCTLCYHRITKGLPTACVAACPTGTRMFGDAKQLGDEVAERIATQRVHVLKPELHTQPNCYYQKMSGEVR